MKSILGENIQGRLLKVLEKRNREIVELTKKEDIKIACHKENRRKFTQTNNTLAISGRLAQELEYLETSLACNRILNRIYLPPAETNQYTKDLLEALAKLP